MNTAGTLAAMFDLAVSRNPDGAAYHYFDGSRSYRQLDEDSDALACFLREHGVGKGGRVMACLQNVPATLIVLVACAKIGAITVLANPMYKARELAGLFEDCRPSAIVCHDSTVDESLHLLAEEGDAHLPAIILAVSAHDRQTRNDPWLGDPYRHRPLRGASRFEDALAAKAGEVVERAALDADDTAMLVYTSGTTGRPKGAMISHGNMFSAARFYRDWVDLRETDAVLALAPLFHVTGLSGHIFLAIDAAAPVIFNYRFEPRVMLEAVVEHKPSFTVGAITALNALTGYSGFRKEQFSSLRAILSGGAPIPPAVRQQFFDRTGLWIGNVYGLTETSGPITASPVGADIPVDPQSGALSTGIAVNCTLISFRDGDGREAPVGEVGELVAQGPGVVSGYWNKPQETEEAMREFGFMTGDMGFRDEQGWVYLVDRKKDMIIASGYKVWPREVEDVIYLHPAVREVAVVGVQDQYRGETVKAVVSLKPGAAAQADEIREFCKQRLAAYKYPRIVDIVEELPKTLTGKIIRAAVRD
ncbi:AMP-binding protein [Tsuneonella sp. CC-YZS046]|uniref:AMP-binding protein n=1 Tax=Tsuneonella sp. CC-YZS046 TaxID=3042152 RepID=UPI002D76E519|nr:AMP-binding protein [Tsuneonella sp. CC-YZS046]WRO66991.1 AMP-binding protein [Tsuneonella sp. CC-YZS046]